MLNFFIVFVLNSLALNVEVFKENMRLYIAMSYELGVMDQIGSEMLHIECANLRYDPYLGYSLLY